MPPLPTQKWPNWIFSLWDMANLVHKILENWQKKKVSKDAQCCETCQKIIFTIFIFWDMVISQYHNITINDQILLVTR